MKKLQQSGFFSYFLFLIINPSCLYILLCLVSLRKIGCLYVAMKETPNSYMWQGNLKTYSRVLSKHFILSNLSHNWINTHQLSQRIISYIGRILKTFQCYHSHVCLCSLGVSSNSSIKNFKGTNRLNKLSFHLNHVECLEYKKIRKKHTFIIKTMTEKPMSIKATRLTFFSNIATSANHMYFFWSYIR